MQYEHILLALELISAGLAAACLAVKSQPLKGRLIACLLVAASAFVLGTNGREAFMRSSNSQNGDSLEARNIELLMRFQYFQAALDQLLAEAQKKAGAGSIGAELKSKFGDNDQSKDKWTTSISDAARQSVQKNPGSVKYRLQEIVARHVVEAPIHDQLMQLQQMPEAKGPEAPVVEMLLQLYGSSGLSHGSGDGKLMATIDKSIRPGLFRDFIKLQYYDRSGEKQKHARLAADLTERNFYQVLRIFGVITIAMIFTLCGICTLIGVLATRKRLSSADRESADLAIRSPVNYGFIVVYGVFVAWMSFNLVANPFVKLVLEQLKGIGHGPTAVALMTLGTYVWSMAPALIFIYMFATKPNNLPFWRTARLSLQTEPPLNSTRKKYGPFSLIFIGVLTYLAAIPVNVALGILVSKIFHTQGSSSPIISILLNAIGSSDAVAFIIFIIALGVMPAIFEETLFRGFLYPALRWKFGPMAAMCISALAFSLIHLDFGAASQLFVLGFMFAFAYEKTGSLVPPMVAHCLWNSSTFIVMSAFFSS